MNKVIACIVAMASIAGAEQVYVWEKKAFETRYVFVVAGTDSARVVKFLVAKGAPRKESETMLPRIDSGAFAGEGGRVRLLGGDSAEIRLGSRGKALPLRAAPRSRLDSLCNRAAFAANRPDMIRKLKGVLPRTVEAGLFYDRQARSHGIPQAMASDPAAFDGALRDFNAALLDSVQRERR